MVSNFLCSITQPVFSIVQLPIELLVQIFELAALSTPKLHIDAGNTRSSLITTQRISAVCSSWREIALNCSHLWAEMYFWKAPSQELLELWLTRSKGDPLKICVDLEDPSWSTYPKLEQFAEGLVTHASRFYSLCVHAHPNFGNSLAAANGTGRSPSSAPSPRLAGHNPMVSPLLQQLAVGCKSKSSLQIFRYRDNSKDIPWGVVHRSNMAKENAFFNSLKVLDVHGRSVHCWWAAHGLTEYRLWNTFCPSLHHILTVIKNSPNLVVLELVGVEVMGIRGFEPLYDDPVQLLSLKEFRLQCDNNCQSRNILPFIYAPHITKLSLNLYDDYYRVEDRNLLSTFLNSITSQALDLEVATGELPYFPLHSQYLDYTETLARVFGQARQVSKVQFKYLDSLKDRSVYDQALHWTSLHEVTVEGGSIVEATLQSLASATESRISKLKVGGVLVYNDSQALLSPEEWASMVQSLREKVDVLEINDP